MAPHHRRTRRTFNEAPSQVGGSGEEGRGGKRGVIVVGKQFWDIVISYALQWLSASTQPSPWFLPSFMILYNWAHSTVTAYPSVCTYVAGYCLL